MKKICKKCAVTISVISSRINNDVRYGRDRGLIKTMTTEITATATNEKTYHSNKYRSRRASE